jgi:hypothetical protein
MSTPIIPNGRIRVWVTAEIMTNESVEFGDADRRGWMSDLNSSEPAESRNYVSPIWECEISDGALIGDILTPDEFADELRTVISRLGAYETDDGSTLYGVDGVIWDYSTDETWSYALHAEVKHYESARGYVESPVDIIALAGLER